MNRVLILALLGFATSCATVISGTSQAITIDSNVQGADVKIEGNSVGVTPYSGKIKRQKEAIAFVSAAGYSAQSVTLTTSFNPVAILSIFWDYSTTDCLTGAVWEYSPNSYYVNLKPLETADSEFRRESTLKAFAMTYFPEIQVELAASGGPRLESLRTQFADSVSPEEFLGALSTLNRFDAVSFGEGVPEAIRSL